MKDARTKFREWSLDRSLAQNVSSLYGVQFANYLLPLITIPYLTRVLGPGMWGLVAFAQAFGAYASMGIDYGFSFSATREVAKNRGSKDELAKLMAGVTGAKVVLAAGAVSLAFLIEPLVPLFRRHPIFLWAAVFWAIAQSFSMMWYYQGVERMRLVAVLDVTGKALATAGIFILVRQPSDGWKVLALQGGGMLLSAAIATVIVYKEVPVKLPTFPLVRDSMRLGWNMFLLRNSISLYDVGNAFILGLFAPPEAVGFFAGAEKIAGALVGLMAPIHKSLYPRISRLVQHDRPRAKRLARFSMFAMGSAGTVFSLAAFLGAPWFIPIVLGKSFGASIPVLRIMAPLPLLEAISISFGILWMLPLGLERQLNKVILAATVLNLGLAVVLAPRFAELGVAGAGVMSELFVAVTLYFFLRRQGLTLNASRQESQIAQ